MLKLLKIILIIFIILVIIAIAGFIALMVASDWNLENFKYVEKEYQVEENFESIKLNLKGSDVVIRSSNDEKCKVVCFENNIYSHSVDVINNELVVGCNYKTKIFFSYKESKITIYLPEKDYKTLNLTTTSGDVDVENLKVDELTITVSSGDVEVNNVECNNISTAGESGDVELQNIKVNGAVSVARDSGDVELSNVSCNGNLSTSTDSGDISLENVVCGGLSSECDSGDVKLESVLVNGALTIEAESGDVEFSKLDASSLDITTTSGDVKGSLLSDKIFAVRSSSGEIDVPQTTTGGVCKITVRSGDVIITISK